MRLTTQRLKAISVAATIYAVGLDEDDAWPDEEDERRTWEAIEAIDYLIAKRKKAGRRKPKS